MKTFKKVLSLALALVMVVGALVVLPTEAKAADSTSIWSGSVESGDWATNFEVPKENFADLKFDGTEVLEITYVSTDTTLWGSQFTVETTWWTEIDACVNASIATTDTVKYVILTDDYAVLKEQGLMIRGYNWTITDVSVRAALADAKAIYSETLKTGDWATVATVDADKFADLKFDGTETLVIKYAAESVATGEWCSFKAAINEGNWGTTLVDENVNMVAVPTIKEIVLTSDYAGLAENGLGLGGHNLVVTEISLVGVEEPAPTPDSEATPTPTPEDKIETTGDFSMVLPLVLVTFGGAVVVIASKKRFA